MSDRATMMRSREAWSEFGDEFADIARRFRDNYESLTEAAEAGTEQSRTSVKRAVDSVRKALGDIGDSLNEVLNDPKVRDESTEAGSALLKAFGVTLAELGETLQRAAREETNKAE